MAKRVTIIDDDHGIAKGAAIALSRAGYETNVITNTDDFPHLQQTPPDLIVIDVNMQDVFGDDVCHFLRYSWRVTVPIFLWSGISEDSLRRRADQSGASGYVCKEWGFDALVAAVQSTLETKTI